MSHPRGAGVRGCGRRYHCLLWDQRKTVEEEVIQCGVVAGARFRIPVQNLAGARGIGLVGKDPPGSSTIRVVHRFSLLSFQP